MPSWRGAVAHGYRTDNPSAPYRLLPKRRPKQTHNRDLPWADVPTAIATTRASKAWLATKLAFEFLVLTAARSGEVRGATWDEVDLAGGVWTIPQTG